MDPTIDARKREGDLLVSLGGDWKLHGKRPPAREALAALDQVRKGGAVAFDTEQLGDWDSSVLVPIMLLRNRAKEKELEFRRDTLPEDIAALINLSEAVPEKQTGRKEEPPKAFVERLGLASIEQAKGSVEFVTLVGESLLSMLRVIRAPRALNWRDFWLTAYETSVGALPIVGLIGFLTGLILAFVGSIQLQKFGATIYVANLVALGMVREMGALMTAIIMAGRTGAAFAAALGSMKVNEEIDALKTLAISPQDFLITPRLLALFIMMPLLCLYADLIGIVGGSIVGLGMMKISFVQYLNQTRGSVVLPDICTGLIKSVFFGGIVALTGCLRGMQCGNNAQAVGVAATSAVVTGITLIVVADAIFDVIFNVLRI